MDQYCVVLCGLQAGASGDAAAWQPVAAALKLDPVEFERRVVAALPRIVRQDLDQGTADRIAQLLHAMHVDARALPDDPQLVYIEHAGASRGPLPLSSLGDFIQPGESYRLHGSIVWQSWPAPGEEEPAAPDIDFGDIDETAQPLLTEDDPVELPVSPSADVDDEPIAAAAIEPPTDTVDEAEQVAPVLPSSDAVDQPGDFAPEEAAVDMDAEPPRAMPPPLPGSLAPPSTAEFPEDAEPVSPDMDAAVETSDDELINPPQESPAPDPSEVSEPATAESADDATPRRSRTGRLVLLLVLVALAIWAYRHWMADTQTDQPPPAATTVQPSDIQRPEPAPDKSTPASVAPAGSATAPPSSATVAASVATAASTPAPATSASAPATAGSTPAPAATAATPAAATSAPAPATSSTTPAASSTSTLPASAGTIMAAPAVATSAATPATH